MNKKIQELADQADEFADNKTQMPGEYHPDWHDIRDQKFGELIVKECLAQVDKVDAMLDDDKEKTGVAWVGLAIAKHFGVEE